MQHAETPEAVAARIQNLPAWAEVRSATTSPDTSVRFLGPGELEAIALALDLDSDFILMDETNGRIEASRRGFQVIGTLGILVESHRAGLLDLSDAIAALRATSFRASPAIYELILKSI